VKIGSAKKAVVAFGFVAAPCALGIVDVWCGRHEHRASIQEVAHKLARLVDREMLEHVITQDQVERWKGGKQLSNVPQVNSVVGVRPDGISVSFENLRTLNVDLPFFRTHSPVADIESLTQEQSVAACAHANVQHGARLHGLDEVENDWDVFGVAYRHGVYGARS
jgi:hypothetical protein